MNVYFLSGLGADERAFDKLSLPDNWKVIHIPWPAINDTETLVSYAQKIASYINTAEKFVLVGLSFGGIMAVELNKIIKPILIVIISSISTAYEMPFSFKIVAATKLNKLVPSVLLNKVYPFTYWYFTVKTKEEKLLLKQIVHDTATSFLRWAINEIIHWENTRRPENLFHIQGNMDRIFPYTKTKADILIKDGGHFMVYSHAKEISNLLVEKLMLYNYSFTQTTFSSKGFLFAGGDGTAT